MCIWTRNFAQLRDGRHTSWIYRIKYIFALKKATSPNFLVNMDYLAFKVNEKIVFFYVSQNLLYDLLSILLFICKSGVHDTNFLL